MNAHTRLHSCSLAHHGVGLDGPRVRERGEPPEHVREPDPSGHRRILHYFAGRLVSQGVYTATELVELFAEPVNLPG